jgi:hypothetical protein
MGNEEIETLKPQIIALSTTKVKAAHIFAVLSFLFCGFAVS